MTPYAPVQIGTDRQLFLDEFWTAESHGLTRRLNTPELKEPAIRSEHPWEAHLAIHAQQFKGGDGYRMVYGCAAGDPDGGNPRVTAMAESDDGINWTKPSLGQKEFKGSRDNNALDFPGRQTYGASVIKDEEDPEPRQATDASKLRLQGLGPAGGAGQGRQRAAGYQEGQVGRGNEWLGPAGQAEPAAVDDDVLAVAVEGAQLVGERFPQGQQAGGLLMGPDAG